MSMPNITNSDPSNQPPDGALTNDAALRHVGNPRALQPVRSSLFAHVATSTLDAGLEADAASKPSDLDDPALIVGLSLWTAHRHGRYVAAVAARDDGSMPQSYPAVLADTLRRHADAGDPTCRLVLDWLTMKGLIRPGAQSSSAEGAV